MDNVKKVVSEEKGYVCMYDREPICFRTLINDPKDLNIFKKVFMNMTDENSIFYLDKRTNDKIYATRDKFTRVTGVDSHKTQDFLNRMHELDIVKCLVNGSQERIYLNPAFFPIGKLTLSLYGLFRVTLQSFLKDSEVKELELQLSKALGNGRDMTLIKDERINLIRQTASGYNLLARHNVCFDQLVYNKNMFKGYVDSVGILPAGSYEKYDDYKRRTGQQHISSSRDLNAEYDHDVCTISYFFYEEDTNLKHLREDIDVFIRQAKDRWRDREPYKGY